MINIVSSRNINDNDYMVNPIIQSSFKQKGQTANLSSPPTFRDLLNKEIGKLNIEIVSGRQDTHKI
ncbi:MAG: hypothetical protein K6A23_00675 [Butyrivibrio sp.]|nr:hypothetical protein [Butyrivibrio sp.]